MQRKPTSVAAGIPQAANEPTIALGIVQAWMTLGILALICIPALRGTSPWFGWLPFWLVAMPAVEWLLLRWRNVAQRSQAAISGLRNRTPLRRRATSSRRVRKPVVRASRLRARSLLTALPLR